MYYNTKEQFRRNYRQHIKENYGVYSNDADQLLQYAGVQCTNGFAHSTPDNVWYCGKQKTGQKISNGPYDGSDPFSYENAILQCESNQAHRLSSNTNSWACGPATLGRALLIDPNHKVDASDTNKDWYLKQCPPNSIIYKRNNTYYCGSKDEVPTGEFGTTDLFNAEIRCNGPARATSTQGNYKCGLGSDNDAVHFITKANAETYYKYMTEQ